MVKLCEGVRDVSQGGPVHGQDVSYGGVFVRLARVLEMFHRVDLFTDKMSAMAGCL